MKMTTEDMDGAQRGKTEPNATRIAELVRALGPRAFRNAPMCEHTAMRTGGPADALVLCETIADLCRATALARDCAVPYLVLGGGCNVLIADSGIRGLVIICRAGSANTDGAQAPNDPQQCLASADWASAVRAEAGASISAIARDAVARGMEGLEWASGLPGSVGGAVVGNAGAFDGDVAGGLISATVLERDGHVRERPAPWFRFGYRTSCLKGSVADRDVVLAATFGLRPGDPRALGARAQEILAWRRTRHPAGATMGSTFRNPPGSHAGYLIEEAGLRGHRIGGAEVSRLHGNFLMNTGSASSTDVLALIDYVRSEVARQFGVNLELEIELIGH